MDDEKNLDDKVVISREEYEKLIKSKERISRYNKNRNDYYYKNLELERERARNYQKEYQSSEEYKQKMRNYYIQHREEILAKRKQQRIEKQKNSQEQKETST